VYTTPDLRNYGGADAYLSTCPSRKVLEVLANKWTALLIPALRGGPMRFGELRRRLDGITQKSLTQALRTLERDGLVTRTQHLTIPPRVDYALTDLGREAAELLDGLHVWAERNLGAVLEARTTYDARVATSTAS
jgi:DNA-binding HxlR family transcriptional regulator